jgi:hypothetical protein
MSKDFKIRYTSLKLSLYLSSFMIKYQDFFALSNSIIIIFLSIISLILLFYFNLLSLILNDIVDFMDVLNLKWFKLSTYIPRMNS